LVANNRPLFSRRKYNWLCSTKRKYRVKCICIRTNYWRVYLQKQGNSIRGHWPLQLDRQRGIWGMLPPQIPA